MNVAGGSGTFVVAGFVVDYLYKMLMNFLIYKNEKSSNYRNC